MAERGDESLRVDSSETNTVLVLPFSFPLPTAPTDLLSVRSAAPADCDMLFAAPTKFAVPAAEVSRGAIDEPSGFSVPVSSAGVRIARTRKITTVTIAAAIIASSI